MLQKDVVVGDTYLAKVGEGRMQRVVVVGRRERIKGVGLTARRTVAFEVRREGESRSLPKYRSAAALTPVGSAR